MTRGLLTGDQKKDLVWKVQAISTVRLIRNGNAARPMRLAPMLTEYDSEILEKAVSYIQRADITSDDFKLRAAKLLQKLLSAIRECHT
jgi:hypothetical protein